MSHFAILAPEAGGHLIPMGSLGHELTRRGHQVTLVARAKAAPMAEKLGLPLHALPEDDAPRFRPAPAAIMAAARLVGGGVPLALRARFVHRAEFVLELAPRVLKELKVDGLLVDQNVVAGGTVAEHLGVPFVTACSALQWNQEAAVPPPFTGWQYADSKMARRRNRLGFAVWRQFMGSVLKTVNQYRKQWRLPALQRVDDIYSPLAQLSQTCPEFDFPRQELPPTFHYIGALAADRPSQDDEFPWDRLDGRKLIYASLGTVRPKRNAVTFQKIATACSRLDAQLVISTGKWADEKDTLQQGMSNLPGDPLVLDFVPQLALLERADLLITHAGVNTVLESLSRGVPMVALPRAADQMGMGARLEYAGVGLRASFHRFTADQLRQLVERVLTEDSFQQNTQRLQQAMLAAGGVRRAADIAEQALTSGRPVDNALQESC